MLKKDKRRMAQAEEQIGEWNSWIRTLQRTDLDVQEAEEKVARWKEWSLPFGRMAVLDSAERQAEVARGERRAIAATVLRTASL